MTATEKKRVIELRGRAQKLNATAHIGKDGIGQSVVEEIARQLKKHKIVKVRLLSSFEGDRMDAGRRLATLTSAVLIETRGRTIVLAED